MTLTYRMVKQSKLNRALNFSPLSRHRKLSKLSLLQSLNSKRINSQFLHQLTNGHSKDYAKYFHSIFFPHTGKLGTVLPYLYFKLSKSTAKAPERFQVFQGQQMLSIIKYGYKIYLYVYCVFWLWTDSLILSVIKSWFL